MDAEEFILFIRLLTSLPSMNTLTGRQDLVNIIMAQSELEKPFEASSMINLFQAYFVFFSLSHYHKDYVSDFLSFNYNFSAC